MAELGLVAGVVGLLTAVLKVVDFISKARDDCKDAPQLTLSLVNKVDNAKSVFENIYGTVTTYAVPEDRWDDMKPNLVKLSAVLEGAAENVAHYVQKDEKRKEALKALEVLKACFKVGAAKQKKATEASLGQIDEHLHALNSILQAHVLKIVSGVSHKLDESRGTVLPLRGQAALLLKLQERAALDMANERLKDINVEVEGEGKNFSSPKPNQQVTRHVFQTIKDIFGIRGRVSGTQVRNSTKIRFSLGVSGTEEWFFHVVTCDLHDKTPSPNLFFPENLIAQDNKLFGNAGGVQPPRTFPCKQPFGPSKYDPDGLTLDRSKGVPADGDSPWSIFIIITSTQLLPKGDKSKNLLTIEDIAEALDHECDVKVYVKAFLFDIIKLADVASTSISQ